MNYLTIVMAVWAIYTICAFLFIRAATLRDQLAIPVRDHEHDLAKAKRLSRTA